MIWRVGVEINNGRADSFNQPFCLKNLVVLNDKDFSMQKNENNELVIFRLEQSGRSYWKRVLISWGQFSVLLIIGIAISLIIHGADKYIIMAFLFLTLISFLYSCIINKNILFALTHNATSGSLRLTTLEFSKTKDILIENLNDFKILTRKRYRYRYPKDCLIIILRDKKIYSQEQCKWWTSEDFAEIETYFKSIKR